MRGGHITVELLWRHNSLFIRTLSWYGCETVRKVNMISRIKQTWAADCSRAESRLCDGAHLSSVRPSSLVRNAKILALCSLFLSAVSVTPMADTDSITHGEKEPPISIGSSGFTTTFILWETTNSGGITSIRFSRKELLACLLNKRPSEQGQKVGTKRESFTSLLEKLNLRDSV